MVHTLTGDAFDAVEDDGLEGRTRGKETAPLGGLKGGGKGAFGFRDGITEGENNGCTRSQFGARLTIY